MAEQTQPRKLSTNLYQFVSLVWQGLPPHFGALAFFLNEFPPVLGAAPFESQGCGHIFLAQACPPLDCVVINRDFLSRAGWCGRACTPRRRHSGDSMCFSFTSAEATSSRRCFLARHHQIRNQAASGARAHWHVVAKMYLNTREHHKPRSGPANCAVLGSTSQPSGYSPPDNLRRGMVRGGLVKLVAYSWCKHSRLKTVVCKFWPKILL